MNPAGIQSFTDKVRASPPSPVGPASGCPVGGGDPSTADPLRPVHDEAFQLLDKRTGRPLKFVRYEIHGPSGVASGTTDALGYTERVHTGYRRETLQVYVLHDEPNLVAQDGELEGCV